MRCVMDPLFFVYKRKNEQERAQSNVYELFSFYCSATKPPKMYPDPFAQDKLDKNWYFQTVKIKRRSNFIWQFIPISIQLAEASKLVLSRGRSPILHDLPLKHAQLPSAPCPAMLIKVFGLPAHEGQHIIQCLGSDSIGSRCIEDEGINIKRGEFWKGYRRKSD